MKILALILSIAILSGCASTEKAWLMPEDFSPSDDKSITITTNKAQQPNTFFDGASCLLCIGVAETFNASLTSYVKELSYEDVENLSGVLTTKFKDKDYAVEVSNSPLDIKDLKNFSNFSEEKKFAKKDFTTLNNKFKTDYLLHVEIKRFGVVRPYSSYIPKGLPYAEISGRVIMVNLKTNEYVVNIPLLIREKVGDDWDEKENYPTLTNAYYQALAKYQQAVISSLRL